MTMTRPPTSMKLESGKSARQESRSFLYGEIKLAMQIKPASAKSFATSPDRKNNIKCIRIRETRKDVSIR